MRSQLYSLSLSWGRRRRDEPEEEKPEEATSMERKEEVVGGGQGKQERRFPKGFRFHPTDQELVRHYLIPMVEKRTLPFHIPTLDVYGTEPSRLPKDLTYSVRGEFFCFARRTRCSENGTRAKRTVTSAAPGEAMSGTWHANSNPDDIMVDGKVVAKRRLLSYRDGVSEKNSSWVMHEYCLEDSSSKFQDVVLCKIRNRKADRDERAPPSSSPSPLKRMRAAEGTCVDVEESLGGPERPPALEDGECQALVAADPPAGTDQLATNLADPKLPDGFTDALQHPLAIEPQNCELLLDDDAAVPSATTAQVQCTRHGVDSSAGMHLLRQLPSEAYSGTPPDYYYMTPEQEDVTSELSYPSVACHGPPAPPWFPETIQIESNPTGIMRTRLATSFARRMTESSVRQIVCYARSQYQCAPELQAPPGPVQCHWPGTPPSPSPLTAPAMPASWQGPLQPSPLAFFEGSSPAQAALLPTAGFNTRPPTVICMPINAVPTAPTLSQDGGWGRTASPAPPAFPLSRAFIHGGDGSEGFLQRVLHSHNSVRKKPANEGAELMQYPYDSDLSKVEEDLTAGDQEASPSTCSEEYLD